MFENRIISEQDLILGRLRMADDWVAGQAAVADHQLLENNQVATFFAQPMIPSAPRVALSLFYYPNAMLTPQCDKKLKSLLQNDGFSGP